MSEIQARLEAAYEPEPNTGCWLWTKGLINGYGVISWRGSGWRAHRLSWFLKHGSLPDGLVLDHTCRQRSCVNPDHLRAVTQRANSLENSVSIWALNYAKTQCSKCGGPFTRKGNNILDAPGGEGP